MPKLIESVLTTCYSELCMYLEPRDVLPVLVSSKHLTISDMEQINAAPTRREKCEVLVLILCRKEDEALDIIISAIHQNGSQQHLVDALHKTQEDFISAARKRPNKIEKPGNTSKEQLTLLGQGIKALALVPTKSADKVHKRVSKSSPATSQRTTHDGAEILKISDVQEKLKVRKCRKFEYILKAVQLKKLINQPKIYCPNCDEYVIKPKSDGKVCDCDSSPKLSMEFKALHRSCLSQMKLQPE